MGADDKIAVLRKIFDEFAASGSVDGLLEIMTADVVYRVSVGPGTPLSGEFVGLEGVRRYFEVMRRPSITSRSTCTTSWPTRTPRW